ncbi:TBC1 domain family member 15 [Pseudolycoriella hygida]|uniref:TBC1 domain family member 15 n=1 Tax=Pseudolycoriella hygida TaxID=35572 RepID=A0A9Q0S9T8_9DIPT|nr:TBC1 domain family member 15 [Pseudolycoriella hygida]
MDDSFENGHEISTNDGILLRKGPALYLPEILQSTTGTLSLVHYANNVLCIEWKPNDNFLIADADTQVQDDWSFVDTIAKRTRTASETIAFNTSSGTIAHKEPSPITPATHQNQIKPRIVRAKIVDLKNIEVYKNGHSIRLVNKSDGKTHSEYFFQHGNADSFLRTLKTTHCLRPSRNNRNIYEIVENIDYDKEKLEKTFAELKIEDIKGSGGWISNMVRNPIGHTFDFLAKMSDAYTVLPGVVQNVYTSHTTDTSSMATSTNDEYEVLGTSPRPSSESSSNDNHEKDTENNLPPRPHIIRGSPLTEKQWCEFLSEDGRITDVERVKEVIFRGGIENSLRSEVWKFLLEYYPWDSTKIERIEHRKEKEKEYFKMKLQWLTMTPEQEKNFSDYRDRKCQIEKDVKRTDRTEEFYQGDDNQNLGFLQDILMTYVMYNFDLGYVQGMSDLLAPILSVMNNEVDAFWCFVGFMELVYTNFDMDQAGMKRQLQDLNYLTALANPRLFRYFEEHGAENMYFCFRWLLVWFKREFQHSDVLTLWEVLWTKLPCSNFHLLFSVAILDDQMNIFIANQFEFNEILKHVNELSTKIDLQQMLKKAEAIYYQIRRAEHLSDEVRLIIGEEPSNLSASKSDDEYDDNFDDVSVEKSPKDEANRQKKYEEACERSMINNFF